jgi:hypothetical protein
MIPFPSVWSTWYFANEAYASSCRIAQADDEHFISLRDPITLEYTIRNGEPHRPYTPGEKINYQRDGKTYRLAIKPNGRLRLFLPDIGRWVTFDLRTNAYYDRVNIEQQLGALQAIANMLNNGNAGGIPFTIYRRLGDVLWHKPDGGAQRVKKWLVNIEIDPEWGERALRKLTAASLGNLTPDSFDLARAARSFHRWIPPRKTAMMRMKTRRTLTLGTTRRMLIFYRGVRLSKPLPWPIRIIWHQQTPKTGQPTGVSPCQACGLTGIKP